MSGGSAEELRREALEALGDHADERAREVARARDASRWRRVCTVGLVARASSKRTGSRWGSTRERWADCACSRRSSDALCAAVASAIATRPGATLLDLELRWAAGARPSSAGYRDAPPPEQDASLRHALVDYLAGGGHASLAGLLAGAVLDEPPLGPLSIRLAPSAHEGLLADPRAVAIITAAVRDFLGDARTRVRVR